MIKAVVFDMDGLMFDTERLTISAWDFAGERLGVGKMGHMVYKTLGLRAEAAKEIFAGEYGSAFTMEELQTLTRQFFNDYCEANGTPVKPGLLELLDYLKKNGYKTGIATSTREISTTQHLSRVGIADCFDAVVCGDMIARGKPEPDIYLEACRRLGVSPAEGMALEDSPNGLTAAWRAGMKAVMIPDLIQPDEALQKILFAKLPSLHEVPALLEKLNA